MKKTLLLLISIVVLLAVLLFVRSAVSNKEAKQTVNIDEYENVDMKAACNSALAYMSFVSGKDAEAFIAACLNGEYPEVIKRYMAEINNQVVADPILDAPAEVTPIIEITAPKENALVTSPLRVSGTARGYWFFEATAPVDVYNEGATIIGQGYITATESWMTEDFVPFEGTITYETELIKTGEPITLVFNRANPSGIPDNAESVSVSVVVE